MKTRQCALGRAVETCGDCSEMSTCEKLQMITGNNEEALERLKNKNGKKYKGLLVMYNGTNKL